MIEARIHISPLDLSNEFGNPVRVFASRSGLEGFDVLLELTTGRDKIKILCSSDWAFDTAETLRRMAIESKKESAAKVKPRMSERWRAIQKAGQNST